MNIAEAFAEYMVTLGIATLGQDLFIGDAPSSDNAPSALWWIVASGGNSTTSLITGEKMKAYQIDVYYRNKDGKQVYDQLQELEENLNCSNCVQLSGYDTIDIEAFTFPVDQDIDLEDRKVGLLQANLMIYKDC